MPRYIYRADKEGKIRAMETSEVIPYSAEDTPKSLAERIRSTLYQLECRDGARFRVPGYNKTQLKDVWHNAA